MPTLFFKKDEDPAELALKIDPGLAPLRERDRALMDDVAEVLRSHVSFHGPSLPFIVRGGVVHLRGRVAGEKLRRLIRRVIGRVRGIHAVWDTLLVPGETVLKIIDIGCGTHKQIPWATASTVTPCRELTSPPISNQACPSATTKSTTCMPFIFSNTSAISSPS